MAQVPERCMQMLKQIITEIENRQNITRDQLALLLETTDTGDIAFLHERARKTADAIYGKQVFIRGLIEFTNYCKNNCYYWRDPQRQHTCTSLSADKRGYPRLLCGWVQTWISYLCPARRRRSMVYNGSIIRPGPHNPHHVPGLCHHTFYRRSN